MKKLLVTFTAAVLAAVMCVSMVACSKDPVAKVIEVDLSQEQYGVGIQKGDTEMKAAVDGILDKLNGDGIQMDGKTVTFDSIYQAEMDAQEKGELISIGDVKKKSTDRSKELVVATNAEFAPFEYIVGDSFGGIDMQVAKVIAHELDKELVITHMAFDSTFEALSKNMADILLAGLTINDDRAESMDFSKSYYDTTQRIAVAIDDTTFDGCDTEEKVVAKLKELSGVKAGAAKAQTGLYYLQGSEAFGFEGFKNIETQIFPSVPSAVQALAKGNIQIVCADKDILEAAVRGVNR